MKSSTVGDALCCPEGVNMNQLASSLWGFFFAPALLLPCLILSQPCQLLAMPEDGFLTPMLQTPSSLLAVGRHPPSRFLLTLAGLLTWESGQMTCGDMNLCFFLYHNYLSHWKLCHSLMGPNECHHLSLYCSPQVFLEMQRESESAVQGLACPVGLKVWVHMFAPRPREQEQDSNFQYLPCVSW